MGHFIYRNLSASWIAGFSLAMLMTFVQPVVAANHNEVLALKQSVEQLKQQLEMMQRRLEEISADVDQNAQAVEVTAEAVESYESKPSVFDRMSIGGYGELHYNNLDAEASAHDKEQIDFHRFVLFFGYEFTDRLKFFSEFELEHSLAGDGDDKPGEVELEQAFVEYSFDDNNLGRVGLFLLPIGILNETHEPPTFYGVERNNIENIIVPSTWWAAGIGYTHIADNGFSFDIALHEGLAVPAGFLVLPDGVLQLTDARIRSGRQKTAEAKADDLAATVRLKYTGTPGLELAASVQYQSDITQESNDGLDDAYLYELHAIYSNGPFGLRALYAEWDIDTENDALGTGRAIEDAGSDDQDGWYIEPSFKVTDNFGIFTRYEDVEGGRTRDRFDQWVAGFNYWMNENVVLKADYVDREHDEDGDKARDFDGFNLGFGYSF